MLPAPTSVLEDKFEDIDHPTDSTSFAAIDAAVAASYCEPSPYDVGGYGLRSAPSPSKNCDQEVHENDCDVPSESGCL